MAETFQCKIPFICSFEYCGKSEQHLGDMEAHINAVHLQHFPFVCAFPSCTVSKPTGATMVLHFANDHPKAGRIQCAYLPDTNKLVELYSALEQSCVPSVDGVVTTQSVSVPVSNHVQQCDVQGEHYTDHDQHQVTPAPSLPLSLRNQGDKQQTRRRRRNSGRGKQASVCGECGTARKNQQLLAKHLSKSGHDGSAQSVYFQRLNHCRKMVNGAPRDAKGKVKCPICPCYPRTARKLILHLYNTHKGKAGLLQAAKRKRARNHRGRHRGSSMPPTKPTVTTTAARMKVHGDPKSGRTKRPCMDVPLVGYCCFTTNQSRAIFRLRPLIYDFEVLGPKTATFPQSGGVSKQRSSCRTTSSYSLSAPLEPTSTPSTRTLRSGRVYACLADSSAGSKSKQKQKDPNGGRMIELDLKPQWSTTLKAVHSGSGSVDDIDIKPW